MAPLRGTIQNSEPRRRIGKAAFSHVRALWSWAFLRAGEVPNLIYKALLWPHSQHTLLPAAYYLCSSLVGGLLEVAYYPNFPARTGAFKALLHLSGPIMQSKEAAAGMRILPLVLSLWFVLYIESCMSSHSTIALANTHCACRPIPININNRQSREKETAYKAPLYAPVL